MKDTLLIVDDETDLLDGLKRVLSGILDVRILSCRSGYEAIEIVRNEPVDVVLADIRMPGMDGLTLLGAVHDTDPYVTVIMMTAYGSIENAVESIKSGAYDFIQKPFDEERLVHLLRKGLERNRLVRENRRLMRRVGEKEAREKMVGRSLPMQRVFESIQMLAKSDVTVLILGETGTGKDLAAQAIHAASSRRDYPMVTVNCPALPESILESELFGFRKGAFTGADADRSGLFDQAHRSTIFLDEIGDLSIPIQTKLLRVLQEKEIKPLGENRSHAVDVRIVAATNQDLEKKMAENRFRPDLYYRLLVAPLKIPPLREIREDIPLLVEHFLKKNAIELGNSPKKITPAVLNHLLERGWPGNIRELENTLKNWCAMTLGDTIDGAVVGLEADFKATEEKDAAIQPYRILKQNVVDAFTVDYLKALLKETKGNISSAARISGIKRQSLQKIIKRYRLSSSSYRS